MIRRTPRDTVSIYSMLTPRFRSAFITIALLLCGSMAAWLTHVVTCLVEGRWGFLIAGAIAFPIAIIHGVLIWFGIAG